MARTYRWIIARTSVGLLLLSLIAACAQSPSAEQRPRPVPVVLRTVETSSENPPTRDMTGSLPADALHLPAAPDRQAVTLPESARPLAVDRAVWDQLVRGYTALALLEATATVLLDTARYAAKGDLDGVRTHIHLAVANGVGESIATTLTSEPPHPTLAASYATAVPLQADLDDLLARWTQGALEPADAGLELEALLADVQAMVATTDAELAATFGVDPVQLADMRATTIASIRERVSSR